MPAYDPLNPTKEAPRYVPERMVPIENNTTWCIQEQGQDGSWTTMERHNTEHMAREAIKSDRELAPVMGWGPYRLVRVETKTYVEI